MRKYPAKWEALEAAYQGTQVNKATGRLAKHYRCAMCGGLFVAKDVEVDHVEPCVDPATGFVSWDEFIKRLYCSTDNLQVLDKACHKIKTSTERASRSTAKKTLKKQASTGRSVPLKNSAKKMPVKSGKNSRVTRKPT